MSRSVTARTNKKQVHHSDIRHHERGEYTSTEWHNIAAAISHYAAAADVARHATTLLPRAFSPSPRFRLRHISAPRFSAMPLCRFLRRHILMPPPPIAAMFRHAATPIRQLLMMIRYAVLLIAADVSLIAFFSCHYAAVCRAAIQRHAAAIFMLLPLIRFADYYFSPRFRRYAIIDATIFDAAAAAASMLPLLLYFFAAIIIFAFDTPRCFRFR